MDTSDTTPSHSAEPGTPIGVGIVGLGAAAGSWARTAHLPALRAVDGYELRAVSAGSHESAMRSAEMHRVPRAFGSAAELAAADEVDLVVVAVKVPHHRELVKAALDAGKGVLCEWPLGNGLAEAEELADLASSRGLPNAVGLQARSNPALAYIRDLVADGYVGRVLSTTVVGTGQAWGAYTDPRNRYLLDPANGATLLTIPFGHTFDGVASVLGEPEELRVEQAQRRTSTVDRETGERVPMSSPDQVVASGCLPGGAVATFHYRGGSSRGTNFRWEINGTEGDIVVTAPTGHLQLAPISLWGARGDETEPAPLTVPGPYVGVPSLDPVSDSAAYSVAHAYRQFREDLRTGTSLVPDFAHGVRRHRSLEAPPAPETR
ncbi:Gfo/Idh/MocA family protein [Nocardiopsis kunsanensis]|uniref:Gfo/Idh/MocA family protein n=1 Tax=Nocardiopsis kunsanensis TaxID=141693 RepID=UPI0004776A49|nr:Gfo/Idh/MocA family oxidoreductase [Nocardiopsis kunsanensis]